LWAGGAEADGAGVAGGDEASGSAGLEDGGAALGTAGGDGAGAGSVSAGAGVAAGAALVSSSGRTTGTSAVFCGGAAGADGTSAERSGAADVAGTTPGAAGACAEPASGVNDVAPAWDEPSLDWAAPRAGAKSATQSAHANRGTRNQEDRLLGDTAPTISPHVPRLKPNLRAGAAEWLRLIQRRIDAEHAPGTAIGDISAAVGANRNGTERSRR